MNKTITTTLLILASGLTLSATALAEPFNHGSSYTNAISNVGSSQNTPSAPSVRYADTTAAAIGFNDRETATNETASPRIVGETAVSGMLSSIASGFNDRG